MLIIAAFSHNTVKTSRTAGDYTVIENVISERNENGEYPQCEYRFTVDETDRTETLSFFINHHDVEVYLDGESVYTSTADANDVFSTSGGTWVTIPLYESDCGKEVTVIITSLYENYTVDTPEFLLGSEIAVHNFTLHRSLPVLALCLFVVFAGFLLICLAVYNKVKKLPGERLFALGIMAISAGLWRISYDRIAYLLFENQAVLIYTVSVISLMLMAISMLNSLETDEKGKRFVAICSCVYCSVYATQLILQFSGIADLRQTLKLIHATILVSAVSFVANSITQALKFKERRKFKNNYDWILGIGVVIDLLIYYFHNTSFNMIYTLIAILFYSLLEGTHLLFNYIEQKTALEEMKTQLSLSRTATMMSQIRSHFVFNILNAISGMCKYNPEMADETVVRFARYLRNNIDIMENDKNIPFSTDLKQLEDYVALEQVRFGDKIEFCTDIEESNFMIPPLIIQPVVENAIKHGVSKKQGNGTIILRTRSSGDNVIITVEDDGIGFDPAELQKEKSVGIRNIGFRLEHLVGGRLDLQSELGKGTTVTITIPKENS